MVKCQRYHVPFTLGALTLLGHSHVTTGWVKAIPIPTEQAVMVWDAFMREIGLPSAVLLDKGGEFTEKVFEICMRKNGREHHLTPSPFHPQSNGMTASDWQLNNVNLQCQLTV